jgi:predicted transcriptional regulator
MKRKNAIVDAEVPLELKSLVFQMHIAECTQDAIAAYVGKSKSTINEMLKPLQKKKGKSTE